MPSRKRSCFGVCGTNAIGVIAGLIVADLTATLAVGVLLDFVIAVGVSDGFGIIGITLGVIVGFVEGEVVTDGAGVVTDGFGVGVDDGFGVGVAVGVGVIVPAPAGSVTASAINVTAVCASARPFSFAPAFITTAVLDNMIPLTSEVVPRVACPATCQKMFRACAPPLRVTIVPEPTLRVCAI